MNSARRATILFGGLGLGLVGLLQLLPIVLNWFPTAYDTQSALRSGPAQGLQMVVLVASCVIGTVLQLLPLVAVLGGAVMVARARVLNGFARWILLGFAAAEVLVFALSVVQNASQSYSIAVFFYVAAIPSLLLIVAGVSFALDGRSAAITQRLKAIYAQW